MENDVLDFINNFITKAEEFGIDKDNLRKFFMDGYCYYFAYILYHAFDRGSVYIAAPYGHVIWKDIDGVCYDFEGIYVSDYEALIPVENSDSHSIDFKHIKTTIPGITKDELSKLINKYKSKERINKYE